MSDGCRFTYQGGFGGWQENVVYLVSPCDPDRAFLGTSMVVWAAPKEMTRGLARVLPCGQTVEVHMDKHLAESPHIDYDGMRGKKGKKKKNGNMANGK